MSGWRKWAFAMLMVALTFVFIGLGTWQLQRLAEKEALIATVTERLGDPPVALPPPDVWADIKPEELDYRPVSVGGTWRPELTVLVFTSQPADQGRAGGPGYWVMTPLSVGGIGTIFVNRGFVPQQARAAFAGGGEVPSGEVTVSGIARVSEEAGSFTPAPDTGARIEWVRNIPRLVAMVMPAGEPGIVAPIYIDLPAGEPGALPQGGGTVVEFPNNHLGYAITWFGFALLTPILLFFWLWRHRRPGTA